MFAKGKFTPSVPRSTAQWILAALGLEVFLRGLGLFIQDSPRVVMTLVEAAIPLDIWGALTILASLLLLYGVLFRRGLPIFYGATTTMAIYLAFGWGAALQVAELGWPWNGLKSVTTIVMLGFVWGLIAYGTRVMMLAQERSEIDGLWND